MNKSDYDKYYKKGGDYVLPIEVFNELNDEIERISSSYEQALEEIERLHTIIKEVREYIENNTYFEGNAVKTMIYQDYSKGIIEILEKENK